MSKPTHNKTNNLQKNLKINGWKTELSHVFHRLNMPKAALSAMILLFFTALACITLLCNTSVVMACILLVIEAGLAVTLSNSNYGIFGLVAIGEIIVGGLTHNVLAAILGLIVYFFALFVIHVLRIHGGHIA